MNIDQSFTVGHADLSYNQFDDEIIVIHLQSGTYFSLRGTAALIWNWLVEGPASAASLANRFAGSAAEVTPPIFTHLQDLAGFGLLIPSNEPSQAVPASLAPVAFALPECTKFDDLQGLLQADPIHEVSDQGWPSPSNDLPHAA